jgi:hypothetical protein
MFISSFFLQSLSDRIVVEVIPIDMSNVDSIQSARSILTASIEKSAEGAEGPSALGANFFKAWGEIPTGLPRALLTPVRARSLCRCPDGTIDSQNLSYCTFFIQFLLHLTDML